MSGIQRVYMIFYRPKGSTTYTPVPDYTIAELTAWLMNLTSSLAKADYIVNIMNSRDDGNEYVIFRCEQTILQNVMED